MEAELVMGLPKTWIPPKNEDDLGKMSDENYLPIGLMLMICEFPHLIKESVGIGSTFPLEKGILKGFSHVRFSFTMINPDFDIMLYFDKDKKEQPIIFMGLYPLKQSEIDMRHTMKDVDDYSLKNCWGYRPKHSPVCEINKRTIALKRHR